MFNKITQFLKKIFTKKKKVVKRTLTKKEVAKIKRNAAKFKKNTIRGFKKTQKAVSVHLKESVNKFLYLLLIGGFIGFMLLLNLAPDFANIGLIVFVSGIGLGVLRGWDVFFLPKLDTQTEIKNRNTAYGLLWLGASFIVGATIVAVLG